MGRNSGRVGHNNMEHIVGGETYRWLRLPTSLWITSTLTHVDPIGANESDMVTQRPARGSATGEVLVMGSLVILMHHCLAEA